MCTLPRPINIEMNNIYIYIYMHTSIYIYIYIYVHGPVNIVIWSSVPERKRRDGAAAQVMKH